MKKRLLVCLALIFINCSVVYATPPDSPYSPGETMSPDCAPGSTNCTVWSLEMSANTGQVLYNNTNVISGKNNFTFDATNNVLNVSGGVFTNATSTKLYSANATIGTLTGFLKGTTGLVSTSTIDLATDVSGILSIARGGIGTSSAPTYGKTLIGNGLGGYDLVATSSLGIIGSSLSGIINSGATNQLAYYTSSGTTLSGISTSTLNINTDNLVQGATNLFYSNSLVNSYIHSSSTIPKLYSANVYSGSNTFNGLVTLGSLNGPLQVNNGVLSATTSVGILYGGTGVSSLPTYGQILVGNASGGYTLTATSSLGIVSGSLSGIINSGATNQLAYYTSSGTTLSGISTSTLNINTDNLVQGTNNLFYSNPLVNSYIHSSSTIPKLYSANVYSGSNTFSGSVTLGSLTGFLKSTSGLVSTSTIDLVTDVSGVLPIAKGGMGTSSAPTYGKVPIGNSLGGYDLIATSSLGILGSSLSGIINSGATNQLAYYTSTGTTVSGISTSTLGINLADTLGSLSVPRGGTGWTSFASSYILFGNGTSAIATSSGLSWDTATNRLNITDLNINGVATTSVLKVAKIVMTGALPTVSGCGTNPSVTGTDYAGVITVGSGISVLACTLNFSATLPSAPICTANTSSGAISLGITSVTTSALNLGLSLNLGGGKIYYQCFGT